MVVEKIFYKGGINMSEKEDLESIADVDKMYGYEEKKKE
jgi:hypothetical protein